MLIIFLFLLATLTRYIVSYGWLCIWCFFFFSLLFLPWHPSVILRGIDTLEEFGRFLSRRMSPALFYCRNHKKSSGKDWNYESNQWWNGARKYQTLEFAPTSKWRQGWIIPPSDYDSSDSEDVLFIIELRYDSSSFLTFNLYYSIIFVQRFTFINVFRGLLVVHKETFCHIFLLYMILKF